MAFSVSLSSNTVTIPPLKKILSSRYAESFWNLHFRSDVFSYIREDLTRTWEIRLVKHRDETIRASKDFTIKKKLPSLFEPLKESIFSLYQAYRQLFLWKLAYGLDNRIDLLKGGELYAPNYFTTDGEFNDLPWVKSYVLDSSRRITTRFYLGCCYWLENETETVWEQLKSLDSTYSFSNLVAMKDEFDPMIILMVTRLECKRRSAEEDHRFNYTLWHAGFRQAAKKGCVHTMYYFWEKLVQLGKVRITEYDSFLDLLSGAMDYPHDEVSCFIYSRLSKERKKKFLIWTIEHNRPDKLLTLLLSPCAEAVRSEIFELVYQLPIRIYLDLLETLAVRIKKLGLPFDSEMFSVLFNEFGGNISLILRNSTKSGLFARPPNVA